MASTEPEVATKAPENDAARQSVFPGDTVAQSGASMGVSVLIISMGSNNVDSIASMIDLAVCAWQWDRT